MKKFDFKDITLVPESLSTISSRSEIKITNDDDKLPLIVSPMDTVIDSKNYKTFLSSNLEVCMPRNVFISDSEVFTSISLNEFDELSCYNFNKYNKILVDIANGHMEKLYTLAKSFLSRNDNELMIGNIANPITFELFAELGVDYIRVGIGGGSGCLTSANTGVHYPMASLISECAKIKKERGYKTKIVADGGFRNYDDIIKALALGADYVMLGGVFNKCLESCSPIKLGKTISLSEKTSKFLWKKFPFTRKFMFKKFRGMSTKEVQKKWEKENLVTSEGIVKYNKVEYTLDGWLENFKDYLKSAMSYTNSKNLEEFKESEYVFITQNALNRYYK